MLGDVVVAYRTDKVKQTGLKYLGKKNNQKACKRGISISIPIAFSSVSVLTDQSV